MRAIRVAMAMGLMLAGAGFLTMATARQAPQTEAKKDIAAASPAKEPAPVATDAAFAEMLADYQMILREIERIEAATGTVEIPVSLGQLRERANAKLGKMRAWMKEHGVGDAWQYNAAQKEFFPPPAAAAASKPQ